MALAVLVAYMIGSFPAGYLVGRLWGVNVLEHASGRTGGTNVFRTAGVLPALLTGALDIGKGTLAVWIAGQWTGDPLAEVLAGAAVILGHNHSLFLHWRGGAGVATSLGALAALYPAAAAGLLLLLLAIIAVTRYASLGSLTILTLMPAVLGGLALAGKLPPIYVAYGLLAWVLVALAHRPNIRRLLEGTERRLSPVGRSKPQADQAAR